jgi:osmotically-inducible protein OsmY
VHRTCPRDIAAPDLEVTDNDDRIKEEVLAELAWDPRLKPSEVTVSVVDGVVTLSGWVDAFLKRWAADRAAFRIRGVRGVMNQLEVRLPPSAHRSDAEIESMAALMLAANVGVSRDNIDVSVSDGVITLTGSVDWYFQRMDAERTVRALWGIKGVVNQIAVRAQPFVAEIRQHIQQALRRSAEPATKVNVETDGGAIVLTGNVRTWRERENAERIARSTAGVTSVDNEIVVETS